ncbi:hypothetical protein [Methylibium sp.]|nr:hypothetical protein [Methylibium sp.]
MDIVNDRVVPDRNLAKFFSLSEDAHHARRTEGKGAREAPAPDTN